MKTCELTLEEITLIKRGLKAYQYLLIQMEKEGKVTTAMLNETDVQANDLYEKLEVLEDD